MQGFGLSEETIIVMCTPSLVFLMTSSLQFCTFTNIQRKSSPINVYYKDQVSAKLALSLEINAPNLSRTELRMLFVSRA